ncbi:MAG: hypothetical protein Q9187_004091 [Circinaria calcarea]
MARPPPRLGHVVIHRRQRRIQHPPRDRAVGTDGRQQLHGEATHGEVEPVAARDRHVAGFLDLVEDEGTWGSSRRDKWVEGWWLLEDRLCSSGLWGRGLRFRRWERLCTESQLGIQNQFRFVERSLLFHQIYFSLSNFGAPVPNPKCTSPPPVLTHVLEEQLESRLHDNVLHLTVSESINRQPPRTSLPSEMAIFNCGIAQLSDVF